MVKAWYYSNSGNAIHPIGTKSANELGLYDMSGNVWEWCSDFFDKDYYTSSPRNNPKGPDKTTNHVLRGGSWDGSQVLVRIRNRGRTFPFDKGSYYGFRICINE